VSQAANAEPFLQRGLSSQRLTTPNPSLKKGGEFAAPQPDIFLVFKQ
jgi:hypothetical protein